MRQGLIAHQGPPFPLQPAGIQHGQDLESRLPGSRSHLANLLQELGLLFQKLAEPLADHRGAGAGGSQLEAPLQDRGLPIPRQRTQHGASLRFGKRMDHGLGQA